MIRIDHKELRQRLEQQPTSQLEAMLAAPDEWQLEAREVAREILGRRTLAETGGSSPPSESSVVEELAHRRNPWLIAALSLLGLGLASLVFVQAVFGVGPCGTGSELGDAVLAAGLIGVTSAFVLVCGVLVFGVTSRLRA
jgi:hypothetical protein